jgi:hypothetical protein
MIVRLDVAQHDPTVSTSTVFSIVAPLSESEGEFGAPSTLTMTTVGWLDVEIPCDAQYACTSPFVRTPFEFNVPNRPPPTEITPTTTGDEVGAGKVYIFAISVDINDDTAFGRIVRQDTYE